MFGNTDRGLSVGLFTVISMSNITSQSVTPSEMKRTPINPWSWSLNFGYNQAEILEGASRQLVCAGQTAVDIDGNPQHLGDMRSQMTLALENLEAVLSAADMALTNVTRLTIYTTDMDEALQHFDVFGARFGPVDSAPPMTLLGVARLAMAPLMFEIEATAAA
jgi:enamine deaminase RidA (YjgF/YER057c/UK114 family)